MEHTVDKRQMEALQALADTGMKVSEARMLLAQLEETETVYLVGREKKAMERIQKVHDASAELLLQTQTNYDDVHKIAKTISAFAAYLRGAYEAYKGLLEAFQKRNDAWEANCEKWEKQAEEKRKELKVQQTALDSQKSAIEQEKKGLIADRRWIDDQRATLDRAIERLKNNRI